MPQSFASLHVHIVFSTKGRLPLIDESMQSRLYHYLSGIVRNQDSQLIKAGGMPDHIHLLCSLGRQTAVADLIRTIKTNSSKWIHEQYSHNQNFAWQNGYGAFAVSYSKMESVQKYIANQAEHHRVRSFQDELRELLKRHHIEIDEKYAWD